MLKIDKLQFTRIEEKLVGYHKRPCYMMKRKVWGFTTREDNVNT